MIKAIQKKIQSLYRVESIPCIMEYLISKEKLQNLNLMIRPQVVLKRDPSGISLGVYLGDPKQIKHLKQTSDLNLYTMIVEEVSHFIYLFWNMQHERRLSLLDLEVQGEIDKFLLVADQLGYSNALIEKIFNKYLLRKGMPKEEKVRYRRANQLGKILIKEMASRKYQRKKMLDFLRIFYRKGSTYRINQLSKIKSNS